MDNFLDDLELQQIRKRELFSNSKKQERERKSVNGFLHCIGEDFSVSELQSPDRDPPDVIFREANFEVTMFLDENRKIGDEINQAMKNISTDRAENIIDSVMFTAPESEWINQEFLNDVILKGLEKKSGTSSKEKLDILIYVNFRDKMIDTLGEFKCSEQIKNLGFRSISFVGGSSIVASVIYANEEAPKFLKGVEGQFLRKVKLKNFEDIWKIDVDYPKFDPEVEDVRNPIYTSDLEKEWQDVLKLPEKLHIDFFKKLFKVNDIEKARIIYSNIERSEILAILECYVDFISSSTENPIQKVMACAKRFNLKCVAYM